MTKRIFLHFDPKIGWENVTKNSLLIILNNDTLFKLNNIVCISIILNDIVFINIRRNKYF